MLQVIVNQSATPLWNVDMRCHILEHSRTYVETSLIFVDITITSNFQDANKFFFGGGPL